MFFDISPNYLAGRKSWETSKLWLEHKRWGRPCSAVPWAFNALLDGCLSTIGLFITHKEEETWFEAVSGSINARPKNFKRIEDLAKLFPKALSKKEFGHWEGDSIVGTGHESRIVTLTECSTMFNVAMRVNDLTPKSTSEALISAISRLYLQEV